MDKMKMTSKDITMENIEKIAELFPNVITESEDENGNLKKAINFELLKQELSSDVAEGNECYDFTWVGKKQAMVEANKPINKTLRPCIEESVNFDTTENLYIEGDNLDVLKLLQESYLNKVKMIYIDPPYNTGNDSFIYRDDYTINQEDYDEEVGVVDENGYRMFHNTETNGRFHSMWCSTMYPCLKLARNLLTDDGVIFISIDDHEVENLKKICDEVFGESNFVGNFIRRTINSGKHDSTTMAVYHEYLLVYAKNISIIKINRRLKDEDERKSLYPLEDEYIKTRGRYYISQLDKGSIQYSDGLNYPIKAPDGSDIWPGNGFNDKTRVFRWSKEKVNWGIKNDYIVFKKQKTGWKVYAKSYEFRDNSDNEIIPSNPYTSLDYVSKDYSNFSATPELQKIFDGKNYFDFPKPIIFLKDIVNYSTLSDSIVLDFFSGSATTAHAVMQLNAEDGGNRKFIMVQLPEVCDEKSEAYKAGYKNICEIGKERIRRAGKKIVEETGKTDLDIGFRVLKLDESNMKDVYYTPDELSQDDLVDSLSNIKDGRSSYDLLYQCMLDWGLPLSLPHTISKINNNEVHIVNDGALVACFDSKVSEDTIKKIAELQPLRVVFRDGSFEKSSDRINVDEIFKLKSPNTSIKVL